MKTPEGITVTPTSHQDVLALLHSDALSAVEEAIAARCRRSILRDLSTAATAYTQAEISVCGMTTAQIEQYLAVNQDALVEFGAQFLADQDAGDEQDSEAETSGYGTGFGIKVAIYHNFLANRTPAELRAFLKNRRTPRHTKFAKELACIFAESKGAS